MTRERKENIYIFVLLLFLIVLNIWLMLESNQGDMLLPLPSLSCYAASQSDYPLFSGLSEYHTSLFSFLFYSNISHILLP